MSHDPPNLIRLADKRPSVFYELMVEHQWDGQINIRTKGIADDQRSIKALVAALRELVDHWDTSRDT